MLQVLVDISLKVLLQKRGMGQCKSYSQKKERKKKVLEKMDKCPNYQNNGYFDARLKKREEMNKIVPAL